MNVKEYIQSGIVESYVLGLASDAEREAFEQACADYPEVAAARDAFERSLEETLLAQAAPPPVALRAGVLAAIQGTTATTDGLPAAHQTPVRRLNPWKWAAAACLLLLAGAAWWGYSTNRRYQDLLARQSAMERQLQESTAQLQSLQEDADRLRKPMRLVALKGTEVAPQAQTTIYWDTTAANKDVYMVVNNLPQAPSEMQYQLWALLDGKPIDLGVFDVDVRQKRLVVKMKNVQNAQAFAITLERRGRPNTQTPEGKVYVLGNL